MEWWLRNNDGEPPISGCGQLVSWAFCCSHFAHWLVGTHWPWYICFGCMQAAREQAEKGSMVEAAGTSPSVPVPHPASASPRPPTGLSAFNSQPLGATASAPSPTPITRNAISPATAMGTQYVLPAFSSKRNFDMVCGLWGFLGYVDMTEAIFFSISCGHPKVCSSMWGWWFIDNCSLDVDLMALPSVSLCRVIYDGSVKESKEEGVDEASAQDIEVCTESFRWNVHICVMWITSTVWLGLTVSRMA